MKAVILASGIGSRLMPLTKEVPKCLLTINSKTILESELEMLTSCGIDKVIITTGHLHSKVEDHLSNHYAGLAVTLVENKQYASTNYIYSLWLAKDFIDEDIILLHGDMVFDTLLLEKLIQSSFDNGVLVNEEVPPPEKDFKALVDGKLVKKIGVEVTGRNAFFCAPVYKVSLNAFSKWMAEIDRFVAQGNSTCYAEDALNNLLGDIELRAMFYGKEFCMEIDTIQDLATAREYYAQHQHKLS